MSSEKIVVATIRIPKNLADRIDGQLMPVGHYTTRPDFITNAVRSYILHLSEFIFETWDRLKEVESNSDKMYYYEEIMEKKLSYAQVEYAKYTGRPTIILIRVSPKLIESYEMIKKMGLEFQSFQNFVRASIPYLLHQEELANIVIPLMAAEIRDAKEAMKNEEYNELMAEFKRSKKNKEISQIKKNKLNKTK